MIFDTLKLSKALRVSFTPEQAETLAQAFSESTEDSVATKVEIAELRTEIAAVRTDVAALKVDMVRWIAGATAFNLVGTTGVMIAVAELVLETK